MEPAQLLELYIVTKIYLVTQAGEAELGVGWLDVSTRTPEGVHLFVIIISQNRRIGQPLWGCKLRG